MFQIQIPISRAKFTLESCKGKHRMSIMVGGGQDTVELEEDKELLMSQNAR